jgi:hypothetical protein
MKGRPILGAISGLFFGFFLSLDLFAFGVVNSKSPVMIILPVVGLILGIVLGQAAPFRRGRASAPAGPPA